MTVAEHRHLERDAQQWSKLDELHQHEGDDYDTVASVVQPRWMRHPRAVGRDEWLEGWAAGPYRREHRDLAAAYTSTGFTEDGRQYLPKANSYAARQAGTSDSAVKRWKRRATDDGRLAEVERITQVPGKRATPLYQLIRPGIGPDFTPPESIRTELEGWVGVFPEEPELQPWLTDASDPPACGPK